MKEETRSRHVVISGCSSGGKSTLISALSAAGYLAVEEPGRRIVTEEEASGGNAVPWKDARAFLTRAVETARADIQEHQNSRDWVFFDRGLVDAASALSALTGEPLHRWLKQAPLFHHQVFLAPPWPEIYVNDAQRRHPMEDAVEEYERLSEHYPQLGYVVHVLPKVSVQERLAFVLDTLTS